MKNINKYTINLEANIRDTIKKIDNGGIGFISVNINNGCTIGVVTDGDLRRAILDGVSLDDNVEVITNKHYKYLESGYREEEIKYLFENTSIEHIPIINHGCFVDIILKDEYYRSEETQSKSFNQIDIPVVIMAGGKGTRLAPFTNILPKPLIPINGKPVIEIIMEQFAEQGMINFYISLNHKAKLIKAYFEDRNFDYSIHFFVEDKPLGTAGSLKLLDNTIHDTFFVSNCDIMVNADYSEILEFHKSGNYDLTLIASMQHHIVPYGVCEIENGGNLKHIIEKPEYDFLVNTGMYILETHILEQIPKDKYFHITHLIEKLQKLEKKIGVYPISEKSWTDIGQWDEYRKTINQFMQ